MALDTAQIRAGEELNLDALTRYLSEHLTDADGRVELEQFPGGHSNLTYLVRAAGREYVLRRGPLGPVPPKAHDMAREFGILKAVHPVFAAAPEVFLLCEDPSIVGAVFFLMERRHGMVVRGSLPPELLSFPDYASRVSRGFVDCLVQLHAVDLARNNLLTLGKPEGFLERQVRGWSERWERARTEDVQGMAEVIDWLRERLPPSPEPTLVHNDFKLDNLMLDAADPGRVEAVLDWEMSTIGDPLIDLGLVLCYWSQPTHLDLKTSLTEGPGWFTRDQMVNEYARQTGRDVSRIDYYEVFGLFKLAVVLQQIYYRWVRGQTTDERFRHFDRRVRRLVAAARALTDR